MLCQCVSRHSLARKRAGTCDMTELQHGLRCCWAQTCHKVPKPVEGAEATGWQLREKFRDLLQDFLRQVACVWSIAKRCQVLRLVVLHVCVARVLFVWLVGCSGCSWFVRLLLTGWLAGWLVGWLVGLVCLVTGAAPIYSRLQ